MTQVKLTSDISDTALVEFKLFCRDRLKCQPMDLAAVMYAESGWYANAWNRNGDASGIFQAMPTTLKGLGFAPGAQDSNRDDLFRGLSVREQLPWLVRYYAPHVGKLKDIGSVYLATFLPALMDEVAKLPQEKRDRHVLVAKGGRLGWAYAPNSSFDADKNYCIEFGELSQAVTRNASGPRWWELVGRMSDGAIQPKTSTSKTGSSLGTVLGIQTALLSIGINPGPLDGVPGIKTETAVRRFQTNARLVVDGIFGPKTRQALQAELDRRNPA